MKTVISRERERGWGGGDLPALSRSSEIPAPEPNLGKEGKQDSHLLEHAAELQLKARTEDQSTQESPQSAE